jgi:hypothetical protein
MHDKQGIIPLVNESPTFLTDPMSLQGEEVFRPASFPRRGGIIAWGAFFLTGLVLVLLKVQTDRIPCLPLGLCIFFFLSAMLISFSYWVDSHTIIHAKPNLLCYRNPFKKFQQGWDRITEIHALKAGHSWRVIVIGEDGAFTVRVKSDAQHESSATEILELPRGDELIRYICGMASLYQIQKEKETWICRKRPSPELD